MSSLNRQNARAQSELGPWDRNSNVTSLQQKGLDEISQPSFKNLALKAAQIPKPKPQNRLKTLKNRSSMPEPILTSPEVAKLIGKTRAWDIAGSRTSTQ